MHAGKISLIVVCSIIAIAAFAFVYANRKSKEQTKTNQDPQYLIEARKNIVGVWYEEDNPKNWVEYTIGGTELIHKDGYDSKFRYKIVNTTPLCDEEVEVDINKETMYLQSTYEDDKFELCREIIFIDKKQLNLAPVGMYNNRVKVYIKK